MITFRIFRTDLTNPHGLRLDYSILNTDEKVEEYYDQMEGFDLETNLNELTAENEIINLNQVITPDGKTMITTVQCKSL